jgi:hypothetical protein
MMNSKGKVNTLAVKSKAILGLPIPGQNTKNAASGGSTPPTNLQMNA